MVLTDSFFLSDQNVFTMEEYMIILIPFHPVMAAINGKGKDELSDEARLWHY